MEELSYAIVHVKGKDNVVTDSLSSLCHEYLHDDEREQALAHLAELFRIQAQLLETALAERCYNII
jgi:hypothetical protein